MKFNNCIFFIFGIALFLSCQKEIEDIRKEGEGEAIDENSELVILMKRSSVNNGSVDDFLDRFGCGKMEFPVSMEISGIPVTIASEDDYDTVLQLIGEIGEGYTVSFDFPVMFSLLNYAKVNINNQEQLNAEKEKCDMAENEKRIECLNFVYPITFLTFNKNSQQIGNFKVSDDAQMYLFLKDLNGGVTASIHYPVKVEFSNGESNTVFSNMELQTAINTAELLCDEGL